MGLDWGKQMHWKMRAGDVHVGSIVQCVSVFVCIFDFFCCIYFFKRLGAEDYRSDS